MDTPSSFQVYNIKKSTSQHVDKSGDVYYEITLPEELISFGFFGIDHPEYSYTPSLFFEIILNMYKKYGVNLLDYLGQLETEESTNVILVIPSTRKFISDLWIDYALHEIYDERLIAMLELNPIGQELV